MESSSLDFFFFSLNDALQFKQELIQKNSTA